MACFLQNKVFLCSVQGLVAELIHISANVTEPELGTHWAKAQGPCDILWDSLAQPGDLHAGCSSHGPGACRTAHAPHKPSGSHWLLHVVLQNCFHPKARFCGAPKASRCFLSFVPKVKHRQMPQVTCPAPWATFLLALTAERPSWKLVHVLGMCKGLNCSLIHGGTLLFLDLIPESLNSSWLMNHEIQKTLGQALYSCF